MAKAKRKNAFSCFVEEFRRRMRINGGFQEVMKRAGEPWSKLSQQEKDRYKKMADDYNKSEERARGTAPLKKKKNPVPMPNRALTIKEAKQREEKMYIEEMVERMTTNDLINHVFYLIHVNYFCKTSDDEFVPAEIAISRFTLKEGVTDVFHRILNPGVTPLGYSYTIKEHSEKTHRIPLDFVKATRGYLGMYQGITDFIQLRNDSKKAAHLYTMFDEPFHNCSMSAVKYSLKRIWETSNTDDDDDDEGEIDEDDKYEKVFKVMSLPILFFFLKNKCAATYDDCMIAFENTSEANIEILNDKYEFTEELACQFHQEIDNVRYCSQSYTVRWAQVIREQCLKYIQSEDEDEYEEETQQAQQESDEIKLERERAEEKKRIKENEALKHELRSIKSERDIKKEKDEYRIKKEKEDKNYAYKKEKGEHEIKREKDIKKEKDIKYEKEPPRHRPIKLERDFDDTPRRDRRGRSSEERRIKRERDEYHRRYDDDRVKSERDDRRYDDDRIKKERDDRHRRYDDDRIKTERDDRHRRYDDDRVKSERDDRHRRHHDDDRVKKERDERHRRYDDDRVKSERDYDSILKSEHVDIPFELKTERSDGQESHRSRDSRSRRDSSRSDSTTSSGIKIERDEISARIKTEREDIPVKIKTERAEIPTRIKTERPDIRDDFLLKTEHLDIPFDIDDAASVISSDAGSSYEYTRDSELRNKSEKSRWDSHTGKFPMPIPVKTEKRDNDGSDFPLPIPIKVEKDRSDERRSNRTHQDDDDDFPMPIKIKIEKDSTNDQRQSRIAQQDDDDFPRPIKIEKDDARPSRSARKDDGDDFPMPIQIKIEKENSSARKDAVDFPRPIPIKIEKESDVRAERDDNSDIPRPIKVEKDDSQVRPSSSAEQSDRADYPRPIKVEKEDSHVRPSSSSEQSDRPDYPRPIKVEKDSHIQPSRTSEQNDRPDNPRPMKLEKDPCVQPSSSTEPNDRADYSRPMKLEKDPHVQPSSSTEPNDRADYSRPIKLEKDSPARPSSDTRHDDLPRVIKPEKERCEFPRPIPIKQEKPEKVPFPMPIPIKAEQPECSRTAVERTQNNNVPPSVNIKVEKDVKIKEEPSSSKDTSSKSRKRTREFVDLSEDETHQNDLGSNSAKIKKDTESETESMIDFACGKPKPSFKDEPVDSYMSHGIKNEEFNINPEDFDIEPMVPGESYIHSRAMKIENEIKKEKR
ncbi:probable serine/threonine-protein kinase kinX [Planococcus citri]|uniref:probable serine/threonine-protein kinase kinX n=1 Tax=Planococcus citri TaxID=170843 RepID=UPI0031F96432